MEMYKVSYKIRHFIKSVDESEFSIKPAETVFECLYKKNPSDFPFFF